MLFLNEDFRASDFTNYKSAFIFEKIEMSDFHVMSFHMADPILKHEIFFEYLHNWCFSAEKNFCLYSETLTSNH